MLTPLDIENKKFQKQMMMVLLLNTIVFLIYTILLIILLYKYVLMYQLNIEDWNKQNQICLIVEKI